MIMFYDFSVVIEESSKKCNFFVIFGIILIFYERKLERAKSVLWQNPPFCSNTVQWRRTFLYYLVHYLPRKVMQVSEDIYR
jgi:hypothetical protein